MSIRVCCMSEEAIEALKRNSKKISEILKEKPEDSSFLKSIYSGKLYIEKKYIIPDIKLKTDPNGDYSNVEFENAIILYNSLKNLPKYILCNEGFWMWLEFEVTFQASLQAMPISSDSTFLNMWTFNEGIRRGIFFTVMSRQFFRVQLTVDEDNEEDIYEYTKFIYKYIYRFREYTWRNNSDSKKIILSAIKAEKRIIKKYSSTEDIYDKQDFESQKFYAELAKQLSLYGSVRIIDTIEEKDIEEFVCNKMEELITK